MKAAPFRPPAARKVQLRKSARSVPPASSSQPVDLFLSQTHTCAVADYPLSEVFSQHSLEPLIVSERKTSSHKSCSSGLCLMAARDATKV